MKPSFWRTFLSAFLIGALLIQPAQSQIIPNGTANRLLLPGGATVTGAAGNVTMTPAGTGTVRLAYAAGGSTYRVLDMGPNSDAVGTQLDLRLSTGGLGLTTNYAQISALRVGGNNAVLTFWTTNAGSPTEFMRIGSTGNLLVKGLTTDATGAVQIPTGTTNAQSVSWANDTFLYRQANNVAVFSGALGLNNSTNASPAGRVLDIPSNNNSVTQVFLSNSSSGTAAIGQVALAANGGDVNLGVTSSGFTTSGVKIADRAFLLSNSTITGGLAVGTLGARLLNLVTNDTIRFTIDSAASTLTGGAGNMTIVAGTGNSRTLALQTTTSGGTATDAIVIGATQTVTKYANVATAGMGLPPIYSHGTVAAQTARSAAIASYTLGAADGTFSVGGNINVTTSTTHSFSLDVSYTDEANVARTLILPMAQLGGNFIAGGLITNTTGAGPYHSPATTIRCKASTAITIRPSATGTFTTVTYNGTAYIQQIQ